MVEDFPEVQRLKTDVFRDRVRYSARVKDELARARKAGVAAVRDVEAGLGTLADQEAGVVVDLFLSYRAVGAWDDMVGLADRMAPPLAATVMVQEQLGLALNRSGKGEQAEQVLKALIDRRGPSSETCGILGRVYKDRWSRAQAEGDSFLARGMLKKAIRAYLDGFETDWRDAYPGINAVTLMEIQDPPDPRGRQLIPIVAYAVKRRMDRGQPDYWDHATVLELAVLNRDRAAADAAAADALAAIRESWEAETTAGNLRIIADARVRRGETLEWADRIASLLLKRAAAPG
jgi:tetratricopeptide (TPR) repeat protein